MCLAWLLMLQKIAQGNIPKLKGNERQIGPPFSFSVSETCRGKQKNHAIRARSSISGVRVGFVFILLHVIDDSSMQSVRVGSVFVLLCAPVFRHASTLIFTWILGMLLYLLTGIYFFCAMQEKV